VRLAAMLICQEIGRHVYLSREWSPCLFFKRLAAMFICQESEYSKTFVPVTSYIHKRKCVILAEDGFMFIQRGLMGTETYLSKMYILLNL
jgi:hypothetical protein